MHLLYNTTLNHHIHGMLLKMRPKKKAMKVNIDNFSIFLKNFIKIKDRSFYIS